MAEAKVIKQGPYVVELKAGDYFYCTCGRSRTQPFCDGAHKGTGFAPKRFTVETDRKVGLCGCRKSSGQPFCDGAHKRA